MDGSVDFRRKADACRRLAVTEDKAERKALWLNRAEEWERCAIDAETQQRSIEKSPAQVRKSEKTLAGAL